MFSCQGLPSFRPLSPLKTVPFLCPCQGPSLHYTTVFLETFPFIIISMSRNNPSLDTFFLETVHIMFPCKWNCYQRTPLPLDHLFHKTYPYIFTWKLTSHHGPPIIWTTFFLDKQTRGGHRKACCSRPIKALTYMSWSFLQTMDLDVHGRKVLHCHNIINCSVLIHFTTLWNEILQSLHYHHGHLKTCSATVYTVEQSWQTFKVTAVTEPFYRSINEQKQRNKQKQKNPNKQAYLGSVSWTPYWPRTGNEWRGYRPWNPSPLLPRRCKWPACESRRWISPSPPWPRFSSSLEGGREKTANNNLYMNEK